MHPVVILYTQQIRIGQNGAKVRSHRDEIRGIPEASAASAVIAVIGGKIEIAGE